MVVYEELLHHHCIEFLRFVWCDNANVIRAKAAHIGQLSSVKEQGPGISFAQQAVPVVRDAFVPESGLGPVGEVHLRPDWSTLSPLPFAPAHARLYCDLVLDGAPWSHCPRSFLKRMIERAERRGLALRVSFENEFYLYRATDGGVQPFDQTLFCQVYAFHRSGDFLASLIRALQGQGIDPVYFYPESGPGQYELSIEHTDPLKAADHQLAFRETVHAVADQHGLQASFLPKPYPDFAGSGCHLHFSLWRDGLNLSGQPPETGGTNAQFMAGILDRLPALMALTTPSRNSFARLGRHLWSGAFACWGYDNREAGLRVPTHPDGLSHFELKTHDASANPYLALGAVIAAGLDGVSRGLELPAPVDIDPGLLSEAELKERGIAQLPANMRETMAALEADETLQEALGEDLYRSYLWVKREEQRSIESLSVAEEIELLRSRY